MEDRRQSPRLDVILKVRFERKEDFQEALIHNISQVGVYLATDRPFDVGYHFLIEIDLPNDKGQIKGKCSDRVFPGFLAPVRLPFSAATGFD